MTTNVIQLIFAISFFNYNMQQQTNTIILVLLVLIVSLR